MTYLLDTNIVIFLLRGRNDVATAIDNAGFENCVISELTKAELLTCYYKAKQKGHKPSPKVFDFLDAINIVPISQAIDLYSRELARLQTEGCVIEDFDLMIACTAVSGGMTLVTDDAAHLSRVKGAVIENWVTR